MPDFRFVCGEADEYQYIISLASQENTVRSLMDVAQRMLDGKVSIEALLITDRTFSTHYLYDDDEVIKPMSDDMYYGRFLTQGQKFKAEYSENAQELASVERGRKRTIEEASEIREANSNSNLAMSSTGSSIIEIKRRRLDKPRARAFTVLMMMETGLLSPGDVLLYKHRPEIRGSLVEGGKVVMNGTLYQSISSWIEDNNVDGRGQKRRCTNIYKATVVASTGKTLDEIRKPMMDAVMDGGPSQG